ncbi:hypothetical protein [Natronolimnohabitans innermongolicus]|uniref:hypothetical protein n=1 Tax=Natronolimnohabitans innermongolicus TaxID=253107 RepID=UPI001268F7C3|nr:hypothetical protein [Natronolimnohabitans innermongolicus]
MSVATTGSVIVSGRHSRNEQQVIERRAAQRAFEFEDRGDLRGSLELLEIDATQEDREESCTMVSGTVRNRSSSTTQSVSVALRIQDQGSTQYSWVELGEIPPETDHMFDECINIPIEATDSIETAVAHWLI